MAQESTAGSSPTLTLNASWYGPGFIGHKTANGEIYDGKKITVAHKSYRFGTILNICYKARCIWATVNDRGPYISGRDLDLSVASAEALHFTGVHPVQVNVVSVPLPREPQLRKKDHDETASPSAASIQPNVPLYPHLRHVEEE